MGWLRVRLPAWVPQATAADRVEPGESQFEALDRVLSVAERLPPGPAGDVVRRSVCELIETSSARQRRARIASLLDIIESVRRRRAAGRSHASDPDSGALEQLSDAVRQIAPPPK